MKISDQLKSLGLKINKVEKIEKNNIDFDYPNSELVKSNYGHFYQILKKYKLPLRHGDQLIQKHSVSKILAHWNNSPEVADISLEKFLFFDTETTGLSGGTGTYAFLIGCLYFEDNEIVLNQIFMPSPDSEAACLEAFSKILENKSILVSYNGKSYDTPLLKTRFLINQINQTFESIIQLDLLHLCRRLWSYSLDSCALGNIEYKILGLLRSHEDVDGYLIPQLYFDFLKNLDFDPLKSVMYHNEQDLLSLAGLFAYINFYFENPQNKKFESDDYGLATILEKNGEIDLSVKFYEIARKNVKDQELYIKILKKLSYLYKRRNHFELAIPIWNELQKFNNIESFIEEAKYFEHIKKDYNSALTKLFELMSLENINVFGNTAFMKELLHRQNRLKEKLSKRKVEENYEL